MRCLVCANLSLKPICKKCLDSLPIHPTSRVLECGLKVYSFFGLSDIAPLLYSKYHRFGSRVLAHLARHCARYFFAKASLHPQTIAIGLDDVPRGFYAHTAFIVKEFCKASNKTLHPQYGTLIAQNPISYAGKNLAFRQKNPRNFLYKPKLHNTHKEVIIFDDIITSGLTLTQAYQCLTTHDVRVLFALTLADSKL